MVRRLPSLVAIAALALVAVLTGSAATHALQPPVAAAAALDPEECICDNTTIMAPISTYLTCIDTSTFESGVYSIDGECDIYCEQTKKCSFLIYVYGNAPVSCGVGCDFMSRMPPYQMTFVNDLLIAFDKDCGTEVCLDVISKCNSSCTGSCTAPYQSVSASFTIKCAECELEGQ
jgi:hypothetical protein